MTLPDGWKQGRLGELCSIEIGGTPSRGVAAYWDSAHDTSNVWVSIRDMRQRLITGSAEHISDLGVKKSNVKLQQPGTVLLSFKLSIGRVAIAAVPLFTNEAIAGLSPTGLTRDFLFHGLQGWDLLQGVDQAIKGATLNKQKLKQILFEYPESGREQAKVAEVLSTVDRAIEQTEALIAKQQRIKTGLMQDLLTCGIDEHGNLRSEQTHEFKDSPLGRIPAEWGTFRLDQMTRPDSPITYGVVQPGRPDENGVRFVRGGDICDGIVRMDQLRTISKTISATYKRTVLEGGELVMSLVGYPGEVAVIPTSLAGANIARQAALVRLASVHDAHFVMFYLMSIPGKRQVFGSTLGSAQQVVNLKDLRTVVVPRPSPAEEGAIRERVDALYDGIEAQARSLKKLFLLKRGLMQDLLTGNSRVTPLLEQRQRVTT